jgi:hypothetical protein
MKFKLKESAVTVRGETMTIRELTHAERLSWVKAATADKYVGPSLLISLGVTDPKTTEAEAGEWPAEVVTTVSEAIMALSNMNTKKEDPAKKQPDAG